MATMRSGAGRRGDNRPPPLFSGVVEEPDGAFDHTDNVFVNCIEGFTCPPPSPMPSSPEVVLAAPYTFWIPDVDPEPWLVQGELRAQRCCPARRVSAKVVNNSDLPSFLENEGRVLRILHNDPHPGVVVLRDTVSTKDRSFIVVEELQGNLTACVHNRGRFSEPSARHVFKQLVSTVAHCHKHHITLQHLRPEKIFFRDLERCSVVIADFDGAVVSPPQGPLMVRQSAQSWPFSSPEVGRLLKSVSGVAIDSWALGVVLFFMLTGTYPYVDHVGRDGLRHSAVRFPEHVSTDARRLVSKLLDADHKVRPSPATILEDPWMVAKAAESTMIRCSSPPSTYRAASHSFFLSSILGNEQTDVPDQLVPSVEPEEPQSTNGLSVERSVSDLRTTTSTPLTPMPLSPPVAGLVKSIPSSTKKRRAEPLTNGFGPALRRRLTMLAADLTF